MDSLFSSSGLPPEYAITYVASCGFLCIILPLSLVAYKKRQLKRVIQPALTQDAQWLATVSKASGSVAQWTSIPGTVNPLLKEEHRIIILSMYNKIRKFHMFLFIPFLVTLGTFIFSIMSNYGNYDSFSFMFFLYIIQMIGYLSWLWYGLLVSRFIIRQYNENGPYLWKEREFGWRGIMMEVWDPNKRIPKGFYTPSMSPQRNTVNRPPNAFANIQEYSAFAPDTTYSISSTQDDFLPQYYPPPPPDLSYVPGESAYSPRMSPFQPQPPSKAFQS